MSSQQEILKAVSRLDRALSKRFKAKGKTAEARIAKVLPKLRKKQRANAAAVLDAARRVRIMPGGPLPAVGPVTKMADQVIASVGETPKDRKLRQRSRSSWLVSLLLNLAIAAVLFAAFVYIARMNGAAP